MQAILLLEKIKSCIYAASEGAHTGTVDITIGLGQKRESGPYLTLFEQTDMSMIRVALY